MNLGGWNHRVMRREEDGQNFYQIHEVWYDKDGKPWEWTENAPRPFGYTVEELKVDYEMMRSAFELPVLDYEDGKEVEPTAGIEPATR